VTFSVTIHGEGELSDPLGFYLAQERESIARHFHHRRRAGTKVRLKLFIRDFNASQGITFIH
jgi:hypothetical protein